ncbi:MAG: alpha/beta fold hydrolase [Gammaproteobacteria bacterium]|nr:alpha/beta fold hydrolase [Gammaproteobacteria bacterium]
MNQALKKQIHTTPPFFLRMSEHTLVSWDGTELFYRAWHPLHIQKKALLVFHGGHEHSGRFHELVHRLGLRDVSVFAWDARGHGRSPGVRGHARHFHDFVRDADAFIRHVSETYGIPTSDMVLLGHSVGSVIICTWLLDYARPVRGAVIGSPAFHVKLYVPFALPGLRLLQRLFPNASVQSYVRPAFLTHDRWEAEARRTDGLITSRISVSVLTSLFDTANRVIAGAGSITTPILCLSAGKDWVVHQRAHQAFIRNLGSPAKALRVYPDFFHEIFHEKDRHLAVQDARQFIEAVFSGDWSGPARRTPGPAASGIHARLSQPAPWFRPRTWLYAITRLALRTAGRLSRGIRIGLRSGFDSGPMLDYVYENSAQGWTSLGRFIDRQYLHARGWRHIRTREEHLRVLLRSALDRLLRDHESVHILDPAAGAGRYILRTLAEINDTRITALCRDIDEAGLRNGRELAGRMGINGVRFERADAFDPEAMRNAGTRPDVVIVSGLFELFPSDDLVGRTLRAIHGALRPGRILIYTNQPHHPQLELIARTLNNREGTPWVMRPRPQADMNALVGTAGFEPRDMLMDDEGVFTVTLAARL